MKFESIGINTGLQIQLHDKKKTKFNKPQASYITLIQEAIMKSPNQGLTLNEIYESLKKDYECFRTMEYEGWKNSIRHNLSLNDCFVKVPKVKGKIGKGHFWRIDPNAKSQFNENTIRRRPRGYRTIHNKQNESLNSNSIKIHHLNNENVNYTNEQSTILYQTDASNYFNTNQQAQQISLKTAAQNPTNYTNSTSLNNNEYFYHHPISTSASNEIELNGFHINSGFNQTIEEQKAISSANQEQFNQISSTFNTHDIAPCHSYNTTSRKFDFELNMPNHQPNQYNHHFDINYLNTPNVASSNPLNNDIYQTNTPTISSNYLCNSTVLPSIDNPNATVFISLVGSNVSSTYNEGHPNIVNKTLPSFSKKNNYEISTCKYFDAKFI